MSGALRIFKILLSRGYEIAVWGALAGLAVHAVVSTEILDRSPENRDATTTSPETSELLDLSQPHSP